MALVRCLPTLVLIFISLTNGLKSQELKNSNTLLQILWGKDSKVDYVLSNADKFHFQLILSTVIYDQGQEQLVHADINKDKYYFFPASLIKLPLAVVAAEKMSLLAQVSHVSINDSVVVESCACDLSTGNYVKKTEPATFRQILREMLILSNNAAYNFIFDFIGKDFFNTRIRELGYTRINLRNRFYYPCTEDQQNWFGGIKFYGKDNTLKYELACQRGQFAWPNDTFWPHVAGIKHRLGRTWVDGPKNYIEGNYLSLWETHRLLIQLMGHGDSEKGRSLALDSSTRNELIDALGSYPRELQSVYYSNMKFPDSYYKFFLDPATMRTGEGQLRIYNKVGIAGGFISDVSFFHDQQTGLKFYLSGAIMAKKDGIPENGRYDYYDIGIPVFRKIGEILFQYLLATLPDDTD